MEQFNTIPTSGNWADIAGILDANFLRCWTALVQSESLIGLDGSNFKGIFTSADALPEMTEPGWALVGTSLSALKLYVYNEGSTDWALLNDTTYNFTNFTEFQTQLDALSSQVATIGSKLGDLANLQTEDKTSLVNALNEVNDGVAESLENIEQEKNETSENYIEFRTDDNTLVGKIDNSGADFASLKRGGVEVVVQEQGKGLSTNDFTASDKKKLERIETQAASSEDSVIRILDSNNKEKVSIDDDGIHTDSLDIENQKLLLKVEPIHISVASDGTKDFLTIQDALNSITDASYYKRYQIDVYTDEIITHRADLWNANDYKHITSKVGSSDVYGVGFLTKNYVDVVGVGNITVGVVLSRSEIEGYRGANIVPIHMRGNAALRNLHVVSQNTRYTIHTEVGTPSDNANVTQLIENCIVDYLGNPDSSYFSDHWSSGCPWGCGLLSGQTCIFRNCVIIGGGGTCHTNSDYSNPATVIFDKCEWKCYDSGSTFIEYGSNVYNNLKFIDCIMPPIFSLIPAVKSNIINAWTNKWNIEIRRCSPCAIDINNWSNGNFNFNGKVHVLTFQTADDESTIKVVGGTAMASIYGENYVMSRKTTTKGYCAGTLMIGDDANKDGSYVFALGNRLGDCSSESKSLIIEVTDTNGTSTQHTITFSNNYGGSPSAAPIISQASILSEINSQLTDIATCSVNIDQKYPEGDYYHLVRNGGTEKILAGMGVVFDYLNTLGVSTVRAAKSLDGHIDGIALEDIPVYASYDKNMYRVMKKGQYLYRYQSGSPKIGNVWENIKGVMYKIGSVDGNFVHTDNINEACVIGIDTNIFMINN